MKRPRSAWVLLAAAAAAALPARVPAAAGQASTADRAVANLERTLKAVTTLQARFEQLHYSAAVSEPLRETGEIFLRKPDRMRWAYKDPQDKVFLYREGVLEMYLPEEKQLTRSPVSKEALESDIFGIFLGTVALGDAYDVEDSLFPTTATRVRQVKLTPRTEGEFTHILLEIDETTWLLRRAIFLEWAGNKREFVFSRVRTGVRIPDKTFTLKVPPDTEIIDDTENADRRGR
ncbi:MAG TPA: outer membrane lipoprotein carrier protein LolA [Candidatus Aminicenantes bacterium]|nr:outer membrane lipoprotein carrier protein LolA [Candidatus Aminicenantes bacterium]HRY63990.1 outer membrane lipoprotein carrier protein LolA [Candidatus Aminicenantes bacterium]HRZ70903.1 outer membrane lipoprotein carrier protein LolA [Candidatus Aminicenantes bacterium]